MMSYISNKYSRRYWARRLGDLGALTCAVIIYDTYIINGTKFTQWINNHASWISNCCQTMAPQLPWIAGGTLVALLYGYRGMLRHHS